MFENGNYRRRKRRPKQLISGIQKPSSTSSSIPLDESSLSSSESNHNSLLISSNHDDEEINASSTYDQYSFLKVEPSISPETKKRRRSPTPELEHHHHHQTKKIKTVSAFSSIDALIAPKKEIKSVDVSSAAPCRYSQHPSINNPHHPSYFSALPPQYLSLFGLNPGYNRQFSAKWKDLSDYTKIWTCAFLSLSLSAVLLSHSRKKESFLSIQCFRSSFASPSSFLNNNDLSVYVCK